MKKLTEEEFEQAVKDGNHGYYCEFGAAIGDSKEVLIEGKAGYFLVPVSMFNQSPDGPFVTFTPELILAIGGLPETEDETLAKELGVSVSCASDILYLRSRSRWSLSLEAKLIQLHADGKLPNMNDFGVTKETQAQMHWGASKEGNT